MIERKPSEEAPVMTQADNNGGWARMAAWREYEVAGCDIHFEVELIGPIDGLAQMLSRQCGLW